jgi:hypothetical protein
MVHPIGARLRGLAGLLGKGAAPPVSFPYLLVLSLALFPLVRPLAAQDSPGVGQLPEAHRAASPSRSLLVAGVSGSPGSAHGFAGGQVALGGQRFGILGHAAYGAGNQFSSFLLGAGPSARLALSPSRARIPLEVRVFGGWGRYGEHLDDTSPRAGAGEARSAWGPQGGATLLTPVGPLTVGVGVMAWGGRYQAESMEKGVPAGGSRFVLVVGR